MRNLLDEKKTVRFYLSTIILMAVCGLIGYFIGFSSATGYCAKIATNVLTDLGFGVEGLYRTGLEEMVNRYINNGIHGG